MGSGVLCVLEIWAPAARGAHAPVIPEAAQRLSGTHDRRGSGGGAGVRLRVVTKSCGHGSRSSAAPEPG